MLLAIDKGNQCFSGELKMKVLSSLIILLSVMNFAQASDEGQVNEMISSSKTLCSHARTASPKVSAKVEEEKSSDNSAADSVSN
jgi:hypothetical protein